MALFSKKKEEAKKEVASKDNKVVSAQEFLDVLIRPRVTEKASEKAMNENVYVFEVSADATKQKIKKAIAMNYKVTPKKIAITKIPKKQIVVRGKRGVRSGGKKAYVYLKKGDKIEFV